MARNIGVNFNGKHIILPGAYSSLDVSGLGASGGVSQKTIVFLGSAQSGEPNKLFMFRNTTDARKTFRSGDLVTAGELAWSPSGDGIGAGRIGFIRVEDAKQAVLEKDGLKLTSQIYGDEANKIQVKQEDGTIEGSKRLSLYFYPDNIREVYDNIGPIFKVKYSGEQAYAIMTITVDSTTKKATKLELKAGADEATAVTIATISLGAGEYADTNKVVGAINEYPGFDASIIPVGNKNVATQFYDAADKVDLKAGHTVTALGQDYVNQTRNSKLVISAFDVMKPVPANFEFTAMEGGTNGKVPTSWIDALDLVRGSGAYILVPLTSDESIHHECAKFVERMSNDERQEMRGFYGGALDESIDTVKSRAVTLNGDRSLVCTPGVRRAVYGGDSKLLPSFFTAAMVAGRVSGQPIGEPVTLDYLNLIGLEKIYTTTELEQLLEAGVTPIEYVQQANRRGYRIAQCVTTHQDSDNPALRELSIGEIGDFLNMELREVLETMFVGQKGTINSPSIIKNKVQSFLDQKVREEIITAYDEVSVRVVLDGGVVYVEYAVMPVFGINYVLISGRFYRTEIGGE